MTIYKKLITEIQNNPLFIKTLNEDDIANIIKEANEFYYNKNQLILSDEIYDFIKDELEKINKNNPVLSMVGAPIHKEKVVLPYWMGSLDKIKTDEKVINGWIKKYPGSYVLSDKIDGISGLLHIRSGVYKLYTRGNGSNGMDISKMIPYITNIPKDITKDLSIRGELVISIENWEKIKHLGSNPRNYVSGLFNSKKIQKDLLKYVDFIGYQLLYPERVQIANQFREMVKYNFSVADAVTYDKIDSNILSEYFNDRRKNSKYEIDGIVVYHNDIYNNITSGNPKHGFAFKNILTNIQVEVTVLDVEWNISKHSLIKPVVIFPTITIDGSKIQRATGFNAKFIKDNVIGPGSKVIIIKSGSIIPTITEIIKESDSGLPKMPDIPFTWNETQVDILIDDTFNDDLEKKIITNFFTKFNVKGVSTGIINKLYNSGFNTLYKILNITIEQLLTVDGIKQKSAENIFESIKNIDFSDCLTLMVASNTFGRGLGERKLKLIIDVYPNIMEETPTLDNIINIKGFNQISAIQFLENITKFKEFLKKNKLKYQTNIIDKKHKIQTNNTQNLKDISVLFTGFRDIDIENKIISRGGTIKTTLTNKVNILIIKDDTVENNKTKTAKELDIQIMTKNVFIQTYL